MNHLAEAARFITEETQFEHGAGNAEMLVAVTYRDWTAETTHGIGTAIKTSEGRAFDDLLHWLHDDATAVYRVLALYETEKQEKIAS